MNPLTATPAGEHPDPSPPVLWRGPFILAGTVLLLISGCRDPQPQPKQRAAVTPPVFFDEGRWGEERFLGKTMAEIRRMLKGAIETPVTFSFRSASLQTVVKELSHTTGLGIGITPDVYQVARTRLIDLDVHHMPARHVLDWLTRLIGAWYATEGPQAVFITRDRTWAGQDRLRMQNYAVGTFVRASRPVAGRYDHTYESQRLLFALRYCLRHTMAGNADAGLVLDETGSRLTGILPRRGHAKLEQIIEEMKKERKYEPPGPDNAAKARAELLKTPVVCNFTKRDIRRIADELGRRAKVHIGFDYRFIDEPQRNIALALGQTTLGNALTAIAEAAGLGEVVAEPGRRFWILGKGQDRSILRTTGELPWDRAVVRSYYVKQLVDEFVGIKFIFNTIRKAVTPGEWDSDLPIAFYHSPTGRLIVIHDEESQRKVAKLIDRMMDVTRPKPPPGK